ncbi:MAG: 50S ribosomal protein L32 [Candidatus Margulisbacteria bacterium]|nr:50S ribosomal protein L32 [Candidatus Margulisiibacteriota bacterium]
MSTQKKKRTQAKRDQRRAHWKVSLPEITACPNCGALVQPYHVCSACGQYKGKQIIQLKEESKSKSKSK